MLENSKHDVCVSATAAKLAASLTHDHIMLLMLHKANSPKPHLPLFQLLCLLLSQLVCRVAQLRRPPEHRRRRLEAGLEGRQQPMSGHNNNLSPQPLAQGSTITTSRNDDLQHYN